MMDALVAGVIGRGLVPFDQDLRALRRVHERQGREAPVGVIGDALEQHVKMSQHPGHRRVLEEVGAVLDGAEQTLVDLRRLHSQVELRRAGVDVELLHRQAGQLERLPRGVLQHEHRLEDRGMAQTPGNVQLPHELLERDVLMAVGLQGDLEHPR